jgi:hypothetical protein
LPASRNRGRPEEEVVVNLLGDLVKRVEHDSWRGRWDVKADVLPLILAVPEVLMVLVSSPAGGASWARAVQDGVALVERLGAHQALQEPK